MLNNNIFHINFTYALSDNIIVKLKAVVSCNYMETCYVVTGLQIINKNIATCFDNEIKIRPVMQDGHVTWLHIHSLRTSILSMAIGKAIEAKGYTELLDVSEKAA